MILIGVVVTIFYLFVNSIRKNREMEAQNKIMKQNNENLRTQQDEIEQKGQQIMKLLENERETKWLNDGVLLISDVIKQHRDNVNNLSNAILGKLAEYLNISAGAITGFSAVITTVVVVITLLWLTPLLYYLPQATLAAVIMMAVIGLVNIAPIKHAWHANKHDGSVSIITFVLTLAFAPHLDKGILIGVLLSLGLFLYRRMAPRVVFLQRSTTEEELVVVENLKEQSEDQVGIVRFEGSLYFANTGFFEEKVQQLLVSRPKLRYLVVEAVSINEVDASGEEMLRSVIRSLQDTGVEVLFSRLKTPIKDMLEHTGFVGMHGEDKFFRHPEQAFEYIAAKEGS